jgi:dUTP pyrophosphatase
MLYVRSSIGVKKGLVLSNGTGIIDASYYSNPDNDGRIGISLFNTSNKEVQLLAGERIAQGVFIQYLEADEDSVLNKERTGGFGSSGN